MPLQLTGQEREGMPAHRLRGGQIATIVDPGAFCDEHLGEVVVRDGDDLISLSGSLDCHATFLEACTATEDVLVTVIPNGTHLEITDNE